MGSVPQGPAGLPPSGQPAGMAEGEFSTSVQDRRELFAQFGIDPPGHLYVQTDDQLVLGCNTNTSGLGVQANLRLMEPRGKVKSLQYQNITALPNFVVPSTFQMMEGFLLGLELMPTEAFSAVTGSFLYAWAGIQRGGSGGNFHLLAAGYVWNNFGPSWPNMPPRMPMDDAPRANSFPWSNPAAGADFILQPPNLRHERFIACCAKLTTSAAVANRIPVMTLTNSGGTILFQFGPAAAQTASKAIVYNFVQGSFAGTDIAGNVIVPMPEDVHILSSWGIGPVTAGLDAGDQWSAISFTMHEWTDLM